MASSGFRGSRPSRRNDSIGFVHPELFCMEKVWSSLMLGEFCSSNFQSFMSPGLCAEALYATLSTSVLWSRGIWMNFVWRKVLTNWFTNLRYFCILVSFASKSPLTYPMTSWESLLSTILSAPSALAILSPTSKASYSVSLLVIENLSWTPYLRTSFSREVMTMPAPPPCCVDDPSVCIVQRSSWWFTSSGVVNSAMKSANAWAFITVRGRYSTLNWLSSMAH